MRKFVYLVTLIFLLSIAGPALAIDSIYRAGAGQAADPCVPGDPWAYTGEVSSAWGDGNNWVFWDPANSWFPVHVLPLSTQRVLLNRGTGYPVLISTEAAVAQELHVGFWPDGDLTVTGGSLAIGGMLSVGTAGDGENGYMNITSGTITVGGQFVIGGEDPFEDPCDLWGSGNGFVTMSGGNVSVGGNLRIGDKAGVGIMWLSGGTIVAAGLDIGAGSTGKLFVGHTGLLVLAGNQVSAVEALISAGRISGSVELLLSGPYAGNTGVTPEPATLTLLGIGGLALLRRKR